MTIYLILIVMFTDAPSISMKFLVLGGAEPCVAMVREHLRVRPLATMNGHVVKAWSATCSAELESDPT